MNRTMMKIVPAAFAVLAAVAAVSAAAAVPKVSVAVPRVQQFIGTTKNLYIQTGGNWYRAEMARSCFNLPDANRIGIDMGANDRFDGSSTVIVDGERCPVAYVNPSSGPPIELLLNPNG